jgi:hypothetical protein
MQNGHKKPLHSEALHAEPLDSSAELSEAKPVEGTLARQELLSEHRILENTELSEADEPQGPLSGQSQLSEEIGEQQREEEQGLAGPQDQGVSQEPKEEQGLLQETGQEQGSAGAQEQTLFECNICLDTASNPIVTLCGHLFCWSCINAWLHQKQGKTCPCCKSVINKEKCIPIYAKGRTYDPRETTERPRGMREESLGNGFGMFGELFGNQFDQRNLGGVGFSFGFFPFFPVVQLQANQGQENSFLSRVFLMIATLVLVSIILY